MRSAGFCLLGLWGCDPPTSCERAAEVAPSLVLGQGEDLYQPVVEGGLLENVSEPQGGQYIWGAMAATGLAPGSFKLLGLDEGPKAHIVLLDPTDGSELGSGQKSDIPWSGSEEESQGVGIQVLLRADWQEASPSALMQGEVTDLCRTTVTAEQTVRLR